ncbi:MAG: hypothetical protein RLZZ338_4849 [Cyanobacteriota bacterium]|jgi:hypothetical protein
MEPLNSDSKHLPIVKNLISSIEEDPKYQHLVKQANEPLKPREKPAKLQEVANFIKGLVIADSEDLHGKVFVSNNLKKDAKITATSVTVSSFLDAFSNYPILFYSFKDTGVLAIPLTLITTALILKFTNETATSAAARKPQGKGWSNIGIIGFSLMSVLQSLVAGVGAELLLNQSGLSQLKSQLLIEQTTQRVEALKPVDNPLYQDAQKKCAGKEKELNQLDKDDPRRDSLYVLLYGTFDQRNANWSNIPTEELPLCRRVDRLGKEVYQDYETAKKNWEKLLTIRVSMGNDLAFVKKNMDASYTQHFTPSGELLSGIEATRLAILNFQQKFARGDFAGLGFSLFFLLLSIITSAIACFMIIALSRREDTAKSFSETVEIHRDMWLENRRKELMAEKDHSSNK